MLMADEMRIRLENRIVMLGQRLLKINIEEDRPKYLDAQWELKAAENRLRLLNERMGQKLRSTE